MEHRAAITKDTEVPQMAVRPLQYVFGKVHPLCDPCWLICITEMDQLMTVHRWVTSKLAQKYGMDPHLIKDNAPDSELGALLNPVILGAKWLATATKFLLEAVQTKDLEE